MTVTAQEPADAAWSRLFKERLDWALSAHREFVAGLSEEIRGKLATGDEDGEAFVVVYGCSQVGKTTLILDLMGVTPACLPKVSRVLRGGRVAGQSATATAMQYLRSPNNNWAIDLGMGRKELDSDHAATDALANIREEMNAGRMAANAPVMLWIPARAFGDSKAATGRTRILDLPGYNPDEDAEREHVRAVAERLVPQADLILLVGRGDSLGFLQPEALALPGIEDWQVVPARFRVVTTYSYTPDSVQQQLPADGELTPDFFRGLLLKEIGTHQIALSKTAADPKRYFPLEFGDSWAGRAEGDPIRQRIGPVIAQLKDELARDIRQAASAFQRLRTALDVHIVAQDYRRMREEDELKRLALLEGQIDKFAEELCTLRCTRFQTREKLVVSREWEEALPKGAIEACLANIPSLDTKPHLRAVDGASTNTDALRKVMNAFERACEDATATSRPPTADGSPLQAFWREARPAAQAALSNMRTEVRAAFRTLSARLDNYRLREYYPKLSGDFARDKEALRTAIRAAAQAGEKAMRQDWRQAARARLDGEHAKRSGLRDEIRTLSQAVKKKKRELQEKVEVRDEVLERWRTLQQKISADEGSGEKLKHLLRQAYLAELRKRRVRVAAAGSRTQSLVELLAAVDLKNVWRKVMNKNEAT